jgi:anthranilate synthase/aminodeoxychorismate synthase-like glutamine amidotransferase
MALYGTRTPKSPDDLGQVPLAGQALIVVHRATIAGDWACQAGGRLIAVIDNYDSFTFNLVQYLMELGAKVEVYRNDAITVPQLARKRLRGLLISPGPCTPNEAGISMAAICELSGQVPILGVCLGHQSIGQVFGGRIIRAGRIMHGKVSDISHQGGGVFAGLPSPFQATRYHSLVIERHSAPDCLEITATSEDGEIMGVRHREHLTEGVQFHPESILTTQGFALLANWLRTCGYEPKRRRERALVGPQVAP